MHAHAYTQTHKHMERYMHTNIRDHYTSLDLTKPRQVGI